MDTPTYTYVERTLRMMKFFVRTLEEFAVENVGDIVERFSEVIGVLEGYIKR